MINSLSESEIRKLRQLLRTIPCNGVTTYVAGEGVTIDNTTCCNVKEINADITTAYTTIEEEGIAFPQRHILNFTGGGVLVSDVSGVTTVNIAQVPSGLVYKGPWDANANSPLITSGVGSPGDYYIVNVAGTTNIDGITDWQVGDWIMFDTTVWFKIDNHDVQAYNTVKDESTTLPQRSVLKFTGTGVAASDVAGETVVNVPIQPAYATVKDETTALTQRTTMTFVGGGVTASDISGETVIDIPIQPAYSTIQDEGTSLTQRSTINFTGAVTASDSGGKTVVNVPIQQAYSTIQEEGSSLTQRTTVDFVGDGVTVTDTGSKTQVSIPTQQAYTTIQDEGSALTQTNIIDFQGAGVTASNGSGKTIVTIPIQQAYTTVQDEGTSLTQRSTINFVGSGVTASDSGGKTVVTISSITSDYARGNTLTVDAVYGNDTNAALNPNSVPFLTIGAALAAASSGNNVIINAGVYNESITIPANVCVTGASTQAVIIQKLGVVANTTLVTLNNNSRMENITCNLTSAGNYNLTGVEYATGASITAKIRTSVINVTSTTVNGPTILGVLSAGTSATGYSSTDAIARTTVNVISSSTGITRGVYITGPNRFTIRETNIYARGTGINIVGFENNHASCVTAIRTSTISGTLYDVNRALGTMLVGGTDLVNNTANGNSFTAAQAPASFALGVSGNLGNNYRYYLLTGTSQATQLTNEAKSNAYDPAKALPIPVTQLSLVIANTMSYSNTLPGGTAITLFIYKNLSTTPEITLTMLPADGGLKRLDTQSFSLNPTDVIRVTIETTGNLGGAGNFQAVIGYY
jgi:hypothetical protein